MLQPPRSPPNQVFSLYPPTQGGGGNPFGPSTPPASQMNPLAMPQIPAPPPMQMPTPPKPPSLGGGQDFTNSGMQGLMRYGVQQAIDQNMMNQMFGDGPQQAPPAPPRQQTTAPAAPSLTSSTPAVPSMLPYGQAQTTPSQGGSATMPDTSSHQAFVQSMMPLAKQWEQQTGIPASVLLAININEGNWGNAGTELFGMKGSGNAGSSNSPTWESVNGQHVDTNADFAQYNSPNDAYAAFWDLVSTSPRYQGAMQALQQGDTNGFLQGLVNGGYATDPDWGRKIMNIAQTTVTPMMGG